MLRNNYAQNVGARQRAGPGPEPAPRPPALHAPPGARRAPRPGAGVPAHRPADPRAAERRPGPDPARRLAVLLAYTKITVADELIATALPDDPYLQQPAARLLPDGAARAVPRADRRARAAPRDHHDACWSTTRSTPAVRPSCTACARRPGASLEEIVRAQTAARAIFGSGAVWDAVEALDNKVAADVQTRIRLHSRRLVERGTRWLLNNRPQPLQLAETIEFFARRASSRSGRSCPSCCAARTWSGTRRSTTS